MSLQEFVTYWTGKSLIFSGVYGIQCMSVPHQYLYDVLNLTDATFLAQPLAYELYTNFPNYNGSQYFERIANTPENVPLPGDIMIWNTKVGPDGHVAVVVSADVNTFTSFDENWPEGHLPQLVEHPYQNAQGEDLVYGWLHPIPQQPHLTVAQVQDQLHSVNEALNQCTTQEETLSKQKADLQTALNALQLQYDAEHKENLAYITETAAFTADRKNYSDAAELAKTQAAQLAEYLDSIAGHAGVAKTGLDDNQLTNQINATFSKQADTINTLTDQLTTYTSMKTAVSQTITPQHINNLRWLVSWMFTKSPNK